MRWLKRTDLYHLVTDPRLFRGPGAWTVLLLVLANFAALWWRGELAQEHQDNLLTGTAQAAAFLDEGLRPVRFDESFGEDLERYWPYIPDARQQPLVIVSGMSQNFTINEPRRGDQTIPEWLDDDLSPYGVRAFGLAAPNISPEEALFLLEAAISDPRTKPDTFVFGVCFDKMRDIDLRPGYQQFLRDSRPLQQLWSQSADAFAADHPLAVDSMRSSLDDALSDPAQQPDTFELRLRHAVASVSPLVAVQKDLNANIQLRLFFARNALLGITPTSKRPMIASRYALNQDILGMMADIARANHVRLMLYVVPLNPLAENPYIPSEYAEFKDWIGSFVEQRQIPFVNLENAVPEEDWGEYLGGPDFKHFKGAGHQITAQAIFDAFGPTIIAGQKSV